jgi:hypothetical protein
MERQIASAGGPRVEVWIGPAAARSRTEQKEFSELSVKMKSPHKELLWTTAPVWL